MLELTILALVFIGAFSTSQIAEAAPPIVIQTDAMRWEIDPAGYTRSFVDRKTGRNYAATNNEPVARIVQGSDIQDATSASMSGDILRITFRTATVKLSVKELDNYVRIEVVDVQGLTQDELQFVNVLLATRQPWDEPMSACLLALNVRTNVPELPRATNTLKASSYEKLGHVGAAVAMIACPSTSLRSVMQTVVDSSPDLPHSAIGGPRALDSADNYGSYLFNFGGLNEETADQWIALAKSLGIKQIDFHGGSSFRFGDCRPNPQTYPEGRASLKRTIDKLHAAGIKAGLHTYAFFLARDSEWVSPKPDPRLAYFREFTLERDLPADAPVLQTVEDTSAVSTITGFFVHNSVTVRIDDELIVFTGVLKNSPFGFTGCQRGAWGTKAAAHSKGAKVYHLKECFGLFAPDGESTLYEEVAKRTADTFNECGFDMIYLDALDGEGLIGGPEWGWHYGSKFVFLIWKHLKRPALQEMSTFHHHLWFVRSRMGAWDHPTRSHKKFIDLHCDSNKANARMFLPGHLGWWAFKPAADSQTERTYDDDIAYLCTKAIGTGCGLSIMGVGPENLGTTGPLARLSEVVRRYETARNSGKIDKAVIRKLATPGADFRLVSEDGEDPAFAPVTYDKHVVSEQHPDSLGWQIFNKYRQQRAGLRIEALWSAADETGQGNVTLLGSDPALLRDIASSSNIGWSISPSEQKTPSGAPCIKLSASVPESKTSGDAHALYSPVEHGVRELDQTPEWGTAQVKFDPVLNLGEAKAIGVWIHGDGSGAVLNFQIKSPHHLTTGIADHYVPIDFSGWQWCALVEPEGEQSEQYGWPYASHLYAMYRELVNYNNVETLSVWMGNLRPGQKPECLIGPVQALQVRPNKLSNPTVTTNAQQVTLPCEIPSGGYAELLADGKCSVYAQDGNLISNVTVMGQVPELKAGKNALSFSCTGADGLPFRARVTVISEGAEFR